MHISPDFPISELNSYRLPSLDDDSELNSYRLPSLDDELHIPDGFHKEITFSYYRLLTSYKGDRNDLCTPCQELLPTINFCSHHVFHLPCLVNLVYGYSQRLIEKIKIKRINHINSYFPRETYSHSTYELKISEESLPNCPNCQKTEGMIRLEAKVVDSHQGPLETVLKIKKNLNKLNETFSHRFLRLKIFGNLTTVLTTFEAFLSYVQNSTPTLAGRILKVQRLFLIADVAIVARNCFLLHTLVTQKLTETDQNTWYKKHVDKIAFAGIAVLILASITSVHFINLYFKSSINPQELLKNIPNVDLGSVSCKWSSIPLIQQISQFVIISRIVSELALAYFSKERFYHLSHTILQIFTLFNISQLQWLDFERTIPNPLKTLLFTIKDSSSKSDIEYYKKIVEKIGMNFTILVPGNASASSIQSMINTVYEYSSNLFKNSIWDGRIIGKKSDFDFAPVIYEKIIYTIQLALSPLEFPYIEKLSALITTNFEWNVFVNSPILFFRQ